MFEFKRGLEKEGRQVLSDWNRKDASACGWSRVSCDGEGAVVSL